MRKGLSTSEAGKLGGIEAAKTAGIRKQNRIDTWNTNPKLCKACKAPISYENRRNDFCNHSCAAIFNNKGVSRHGEEPINCLHCGNKTNNEKFCSHSCATSFTWKETKKELIASGIDNSPNNYISKKYLIELYNGKCQDCELSEWKGRPMPLVLDHIDGNSYNNTLINLRVICNNCDALSPTFKGRNKGNGRFKRAERYKLEKELFGGLEDFKFKH